MVLLNEKKPLNPAPSPHLNAAALVNGLLATLGSVVHLRLLELLADSSDGRGLTRALCVVCSREVGDCEYIGLCVRGTEKKKKGGWDRVSFI